MTHFTFTFEQAQQVATNAGLSGSWQQQANLRWRLPVSETAGLEWSPTRSKLAVYGPRDERAQLERAIEISLKSTLVVSAEENNSGAVAIEIIRSEDDLLDWLTGYMASNTTDSYPTPLVQIAKEILEEVQREFESESVITWTEKPLLGSIFPILTSTSPRSSFSRMLMAWAGRMYNHIIYDDLRIEDAIMVAIKVGELKEYFCEKTKGKQTRLVSRRSFTERFGIKVRVTMDTWDPAHL